MKRSKKARFGNLAFFLPVLLILTVFAYSYVNNALNNSGVLVVEAQSAFGHSNRFIHAVATVSGGSRTTPFNLSLRQGYYIVTYGLLPWYTPPPPKPVTVVGGSTAYAVGVYVPISRTVGVSDTGFNSTQITAKNGVTPVIWIDTGTQPVQLKSSIFNVVLSPGQNYTRILSGTGALTVSLLGTSLTMTVDVS